MRLILAFLLFGFINLSIVGCNNDETTSEGTEKKKNEGIATDKKNDEGDAKSVKKTDQPVKVTAVELAKAIRLGKGGKAFIGKHVEVTGRINSIVEVEASGRATLLITGWVDPDDDFDFGLAIRAQPELKEFPEARTLHVSQEVTVAGKCVGSNGVVVDLIEAKIVKVGPEPEIEVTAEALAKDFVDNKEAAGTKYTEKVIKLTGTIEKMVDGGLEIVLRGHRVEGADAVDVRFLGGGEGRVYAEEIELKAGDTIVIKGFCRSLFEGGITVDQGVIVGRSGD